MLAVGLDFSKQSRSQLRLPLTQSQTFVTSGHNASDVTARQSSRANAKRKTSLRQAPTARPRNMYRQHSLLKKAKTPMQCAHFGKLLLLLSANHIQIGHDIQPGYVFGQHKAAEPVEL